MDWSKAIYPPADIQHLIREAIINNDDAAARFLDALPLPYRLGAIRIAYQYFMKGGAE